jgi:tetratricopeptide (TPR) repeat protein
MPPTGLLVETHFPERVGTEPELLAHHFAEAGLAERAVDYWLKAGEQAMGRSAMAEAVSQLRKGLDLVSGLSGSKAQQQELDLQISLGRALIATRGYTDNIVGETYKRARQLCEILGQSQQLLLVMFGEWLYHVLRGEFELSMHEEFLSAAQNQGDAGAEYLGHSVCLRSFWALGEFTKARAHGQKALDLYTPIHRERFAVLTAEDPQCATLVFYGLVLIALGYLDQGRAYVDEALITARASGQAHVIAYAAGIACFSNRMLRNREPLPAFVDEIVAFASKYGLSFF